MAKAYQWEKSVDYLLEAFTLLTELRRELVILHTNAIPIDTPRSTRDWYAHGIGMIGRSLKKLIDERRKTRWRARCAEERRRRMEEIAVIQRRQGPMIRLFPRPETSEHFARELSMSQTAEEIGKLENEYAQLLRRLKRCQPDTEGGRFEAEAIEAEIAENEERRKNLTIDWMAQCVTALRERAKRAPKGNPQQNREFLALVRNEVAGKIAAYMVDAPTDELGCRHLAHETGGTVVCTYDDWREAGRFGLDPSAAPRFSVKVYPGNDVRCKFDIEYG